ncbi:sugar ABC transporter substrate-binding protein [Streptomyces samsunensis]|uniref:sugar ABC transporter substrate-binding protein n=1 Tax=Streptomyces malaysiensis TaxID=92644 RepID=UPI0015821A7A|nr:sugar ABC transporter substrate-binding protein [Streptomyces samsunensis]NUH40155.1 sugar ABC transporter substrate-binding protein [Streptomyces samsunensis]
MWRRTRLLSAATLFAVMAAPAMTGCGSESGARYTVWYADVMDANPIANAITQGLYDTLDKNGVKVTRSLAVDSTTGQIDLAAQSQALTRAIAAKPGAIAYFVLDPKASKPQIQQALAAHIPVFAAFGKPGFKVTGYLALDDRAAGRASASYLAEHLPAGGKVAMIGGPRTPTGLATEAGAAEALEDAGMTIVGDIEQQRNLSDNSEGGNKVMQGILQRFPDVQGVFAYNDDSALGAIAAAKQAGKSVKFTSRNGTADAVAAIKSGDLLATCDLQPVQLGQALGKAILAELKGTAELDNTAIEPPNAGDCLITADGVAAWKPYEQQVNYRKIPLG